MAEYTELPLKKYLDDAAGGDPTPGGGSVAALAGALGAAMASMVGAFTLSSKKCAENHAETEKMRQEIENIRAEITAQVQADVEGFTLISAAYAMPKNTDEEKSARSERIKGACAEAMMPPLSTARALHRLALLLPRLAEIGNKNLITDTGVAALLCEAAYDCAVLNVRINLSSITNEMEKQKIGHELVEAKDEIATSCRKALEAVNKSL